MIEDTGVHRTFLALAALLGLLGVAAGAFGAHALQTRLQPDRLAIFETAARYQMYHALALLGVAWASTVVRSTTLTSGAGWLFVAGTIVFSGSLYLLALGGPRWLGAVTPAGGLALLAGWTLLGLAALRA